MQGKKSKSQLGYTIIEVMIVLAVSGVMFVIAANFINGKQGKTAFTQGVNELTSQMRGVITDVNDGKYSDVPLDCKVPPQVAVLTITDSAGVEQGSHAKCVFRGKLVHFYKATSSSSQKYEIIPLADLISSCTDPANICDGNTALANINSGSQLVQTEQSPQQLDIKSTIVTPQTGATLTNPNNNIGFVQSLGELDGSIGYKSGSQSISLVYATQLLNTTAANAADLTGNIGAAKSMQMCVTDGDRFATISIGPDYNNTLSVSSHIGKTATCS